MIPQSLGTMAAHIAVNTSQMDVGIRAARSKLKDFSTSIRKAGLTTIAMGVTLGVGLGSAIKLFGKFDDEMRFAAATSRSTEDQFKSMSTQAKTLGRTTSFTAVQVAESMAQLGLAGFKFKEITDMTPHMLNLARATRGDLGEAADFAANTMRAFKLESKDAEMVADILATTVTSSAQSIEDLQYSMSFANLTSRLFGETLQSTVKMLGALANFSLKGSRAGTGLRRIIVELTKKEKQLTLERRFGIKTIHEQTGEMRNVADILNDIHTAMKDMPGGEQLAFMNEIFGSRAMAAGMAIAEGNFVGLNKAIDNAAGNSSRLAKEMDAGIGGALRRLWSAVEGVRISIGEGLAVATDKLAAAITSVLNPLTAFLDRNQWIVQVLGVVTVALLVVGVTLLSLSAATWLVSGAMGALSTAIKLVGGALKFLAANPIVLIIIGIVALAAAIVHFLGTGDTFMEKVKNMGKAIHKFLLPAINAFLKFAKRIKTFVIPIMKKVKEVMVTGWAMIKEIIVMALNAIVYVFTEVAKKITRIWTWVWNALGSVLQPVFDRIRPIIVGFLDNLVFAFKNWKLLIQLSVMKLVTFVVGAFWDLIHMIKSIPVVLKWMADNWRDIFQTMWNGFKTFTKNVAINIKNLGKAIWDFIKGKGWDFEWTGLLEGFESTIKEFPKILEREIGPMEQALKDTVKGLEKELADAYLDHITKKITDHVDKVVEEAKLPVEEKEKEEKMKGRAFGTDRTKSLADLAEKGTIEAYSAIVKAENPVEKKIEKNTKDIYNEMVKMNKGKKIGEATMSGVVDLGLVV